MNGLWISCPLIMAGMSFKNSKSEGSGLRYLGAQELSWETLSSDGIVRA